MTSSAKLKRLIFGLITFTCVVVAFLYTFLSADKVNSDGHKRASATVAHPASVHPPASPERLGQMKDDDERHGTSPEKAPGPSTGKAPRHQLHSEPRLVALNLRESAELGTAEVSYLNAINDRKPVTHLRCERIYFAAGKGICLNREFHLFSVQTLATVFDADFQPLFDVRTDGIPSRARISPDGRYAAFTVFVTGHSYADAQVSTATLLLDLENGKTIANLEEFKVFQDGQIVRSPDLNFWGVTFQHDSNLFYVTLRTGGVNYLVHGDIKSKTVTMLYKGVECPSLSPDETRIAFKKLVSRNNWRLAILDLRTLQETLLAETRSVDDQAEWLDNRHVLYAMVDAAPWMSIMVVPSDGTGQPDVFAKGATSPAVVR